MTTRDDKEHNKFALSSWEVILKAVEGNSPATAILSWEIEDLESKKFTSNWDVRVITTF